MLLNPKTVFVLPGALSALVENMFVGEGWSLTEDVDDADLIQFVGGDDVNPALYNQHCHKTTHFDEDRDSREMDVYLSALELGVPMAGICRGGQFLNVMNGGRLFQHVDNHAMIGTHKAWLIGEDQPVNVTSTHHQMMDPNDNAVIVMTAAESIRKYSMSNREYGAYEAITYSPKNHPSDIEALYYRDTRCLCFQPHPEIKGATETRDLYFDLLDHYLFNQEEQLRDEA